MMKEMMVDIETLGTAVNAPIVQIGAVYFSMETGELGEEYLVNLDLEDAIKHGAQPDGSTIYWWLGQSKAAREGLSKEETPFMYEDQGLQDFNQFWSRANRVWSHATFDFVMLMNSMRRRDIQPTVNNRKARDIRTLTGLADMTRTEVETQNVERKGTQHNGLADAIYQVAYCHECYKKLKGRII
jgi:hypothetical protein